MRLERKRVENDRHQTVAGGVKSPLAWLFSCARYISLVNFTATEVIDRELTDSLQQHKRIESKQLKT